MQGEGTVEGTQESGYSRLIPIASMTVMTNNPAVDCVPGSTLIPMGREKGQLKCSRALIFPGTGVITPTSAGNMPLPAI